MGELPAADCAVVQVRGIDQSRLSIFSQDWWINVARESSDYHELTVVDGGTLIGRLPFVLSRNRLGLLRGLDPYSSHLGGPIVGQHLSRTEQAKVIQSLIEQLPRRASLYFVCDSSLSYADLVRNAFQGEGFEHTNELTYVRYPSDGDVLNARKTKHKKHIKRAAKELECVDITATEFVEFYETNLRARGKRSYSPLRVLTRLIEEATARGQARAIAARSYSPIRAAYNGHSTSYDAAIVYVWDDLRCYYWLSTHRIPSNLDPHVMPHPDAIKLLAVKAMQDAQAMNLIFDADGVTTPGTDNLYRNMFGLRREQHRDVFRRVTVFERLYQGCRHQFKP